MRRTKAEAEETRQRILEAAERVFYVKGVSTAKLEDVAKEAGVTRGAIYWHFANKTDLFLELYRSVPLPDGDMFDEDRLASDSDPLSIVEKAAVRWLDVMANDPQRQRIFTILLRCDYSTAGMAPVLEKQHENDEAHTALLEQTFSRMPLGRHWTPHSATRAFRWMMKGMCTEWLLFGRRFDLVAEGRDGLARLFADFRMQAVSER